MRPFRGGCAAPIGTDLGRSKINAGDETQVIQLGDEGFEVARIRVFQLLERCGSRLERAQNAGREVIEKVGVPRGWIVYDVKPPPLSPFEPRVLRNRPNFRGHEGGLLLRARGLQRIHGDGLGRLVLRPQPTPIPFGLVILPGFRPPMPPLPLIVRRPRPLPAGRFLEVVDAGRGGVVPPAFVIPALPPPPSVAPIRAHGAPERPLYGYPSKAPIMNCRQHDRAGVEAFPQKLPAIRRIRLRFRFLVPSLLTLRHGSQLKVQRPPRRGLKSTTSPHRPAKSLRRCRPRENRDSLLFRRSLAYPWDPGGKGLT